jgi:hypothetical protein
VSHDTIIYCVSESRHNRILCQWVMPQSYTVCETCHNRVLCQWVMPQSQSCTAAFRSSQFSKTLCYTASIMYGSRFRKSNFFLTSCNKSDSELILTLPWVQIDAMVLSLLLNKHKLVQWSDNSKWRITITEHVKWVCRYFTRISTTQAVDLQVTTIHTNHNPSEP